MIYSVSKMSRSIYTAAQLALKSRSSAGTWQTAAGHRDKPETSGKAWLGLAVGSGMLWEQRDAAGAVGSCGCCGEPWAAPCNHLPEVSKVSRLESHFPT